MLRLGEQTLAVHDSANEDRGDIDAGGLYYRRSGSPDPRLSLPIRLPSNRCSDIGLAGEGLPLLLSRRGEPIGQAIRIVVILQVFRSGESCSPHIAVLGLELRSLRGRDQSEIVFGVLKIILRGDRVAACVSVARQLKVFFRYMQRRAANSDVRAAGVIRTRQRVGLTTAICLAVANSVIMTKCHFLSLLFRGS
jgi:hypothetical protein